MRQQPANGMQPSNASSTVVPYGNSYYMRGWAPTHNGPVPRDQGQTVEDLMTSMTQSMQQMAHAAQVVGAQLEDSRRYHTRHHSAPPAFHTMREVRRSSQTVTPMPSTPEGSCGDLGEGYTLPPEPPDAQVQTQPMMMMANAPMMQQDPMMMQQPPMMQPQPIMMQPMMQPMQHMQPMMQPMQHMQPMVMMPAQPMVQYVPMTNVSGPDYAHSDYRPALAPVPPGWPPPEGTTWVPFEC